MPQRTRNASVRSLGCGSEATHRFMTALAGDLLGNEEALRALYCDDANEFLQQTEEWPRDVKA
ncbi:MAG: DUF2239 family protein [Gemmataceae bacterium]|nr:DUF2239 family protein [Gemmataceae bacterium]